MAVLAKSKVMRDLDRAREVALPFVTEVWQVYVLIFVLQAESAASTPTFQATIHDVCPTRASTPGRFPCHG